jgi:hypothetical protein
MDDPAAGADRERPVGIVITSAQAAGLVPGFASLV